MKRDPDAVNRVLLGLLGLALLAFGGWGVARGAGWTGSSAKHAPLLTNSLRRFVGRNDSWFWGVAALVAIVVALLALRWLVVQLRAPRPSNDDVVARSDTGTTRLSGRGIVSALEADVVDSVDNVRGASARLVGDRSEAELDLRVEVEDDGDVVDVRRAIEDEVLPRFQNALSLGELRTDLHLHLAPPARHVH